MAIVTKTENSNFFWTLQIFNYFPTLGEKLTFLRSVGKKLLVVSSTLLSRRPGVHFSKIQGNWKRKRGCPLSQFSKFWLENVKRIVKTGFYVSAGFCEEYLFWKKKLFQFIFRFWAEIFQDSLKKIFRQDFHNCILRVQKIILSAKNRFQKKQIFILFRDLSFLNK